MKVYKEIYDDSDFEFWGGAVYTVETLTEADIEQIFSILEDAYPEGMDETELNDFFAFEDNTIAKWLGFEDWDDLTDAYEAGFYDAAEWEDHKLEEDFEEDEEE